jgi:hypothetical protein
MWVALKDLFIDNEPGGIENAAHNTFQNVAILNIVLF